MELTIADKGYRDDNFFIYPSTIYPPNRQLYIKRILARHETVNRRLKTFTILQSVFRHPIEKHSSCFQAAANLVQIMIEQGETLFDVPIDIDI